VIEALLLGAGGWALTLHARLHGRIQANVAQLGHLIELQLAAALVADAERSEAQAGGAAQNPDHGPAALRAELLRGIMSRRAGASAQPPVT
jgi:hypothetical protein